MSASLLSQFILYPPGSFLLTAVSLMTFMSNSYLGFSEFRGKHVRYSKFWNVSSGESSKSEAALPARIGMFIGYTPALLLALACFLLLPDEGLRFLLLKFALTLHFLKRDFEVAFVHKFSSKMFLQELILIAISYFAYTICMFYSQHLTLELPEPIFDLKYPGIVLFLVGIGGNFYHHYLLSLLREKDGESYKIPKGGLFEHVICPHYLFELIEFLGISMISQTLYSFSFTLGSGFYLIGRSYSTKKWYFSKFEDFPKDRKVVIPYVV